MMVNLRKYPSQTLFIIQYVQTEECSNVILLIMMYNFLQQIRLFDIILYLILEYLMKQGLYRIIICFYRHGLHGQS